MKIINIIKKIGFTNIWWMVLIVLCSRYIQYNYSRFIETPNNIDYVILFCTIVLIFMPLVSELDIFGVRFKKEINMVNNNLEKTKIDFEKQLINIKNNINQNNNVNNYNLNGQQVASDFLLEKIIESFKLSNVNGKDDKEKKEKVAEIIENKIESIPEYATYLFTIRYKLEKSIKGAYFKIFKDFSNKKNIMFYLNSLYSLNVINKLDYDSINQVLAICSIATHGDSISQNQLKFVKEIINELIDIIDNLTIKDIVNKYYNIECPQCHYNGRSEFINSCPKCNYKEFDGDFRC